MFKKWSSMFWSKDFRLCLHSQSTGLCNASKLLRFLWQKRTTFNPFSLKFNILPTHFICYNIWSGLFAIIVIWLHFQCWSVLSQKKMTFFGMVGLFMTSANLPVMSNLSIEHWQRNIFVSCITMSTIHIRKKSMQKINFFYSKMLKTSALKRSLLMLCYLHFDEEHWLMTG